MAKKKPPKPSKPSLAKALPPPKFAAIPVFDCETDAECEAMYGADPWEGWDEEEEMLGRLGEADTGDSGSSLARMMMPAYRTPAPPNFPMPQHVMHGFPSMGVNDLPQVKSIGINDLPAVPTVTMEELIQKFQAMYPSLTPEQLVVLINNGGLR